MFGLPSDSITADGSTVAFISNGQLVAEDTDAENDVYTWSDGVTTLVSTSTTAGSGPFRAEYAGMTRDAAHIFFTTWEPMVAEDTDSLPDLYDRSGGVTTLVSTSPSEVEPSWGSFLAVTPDGNHVFFHSESRLLPIDTDTWSDIYERFEGQTTLVSTNAAGEPGTNYVQFDAVSDDGSRVFFEAGGQYAPEDTDSQPDVYEFSDGDATLVSTGPSPDESNPQPATFLSASADGAAVLFSTREELLGPESDSNALDIFERSGGATSLISAPQGTPWGIDAQFRAASRDGSRVFFLTSEPISTDDTNGSEDIYVRDGGTLTRIPIDGPVRSVEFGGISTDGSHLVIGTIAALVATDSESPNPQTDVYEFRLASPPPPNPFVTANGTGLELDGQPFTFTGMNIYNANSDGWCANTMDGGLLETALDQIGLGGVHGGDHGVIRAWFFQPLGTNLDGTRDWARFDRTIAEAKARGYYVIPTLGNQWGECGHKGSIAHLSASTYKYPSWYETGYMARQPEDAVYGPGYTGYRDWVAEVVARYRDEPAILAWQLLNEAETNPVWPGGCPAGPEPFEAIRDWATDVSGLVKSIDPNHLVSLGTIGGGQCGTSGPDFKALHEIPTIDLCEVHDYNPWDPMPGDQWNGLALRIQQCAELDKPLFVGEVGLRPVDVGGSYDSRVASLRAKLQVQRAAGIVGHLVWNWGPGPVALDSYDIRAGDDVPLLLADGPDFDAPATSVDSDWVAPFITFGAPTRKLYTLDEPVTASFSCTEVGSAGLATCDGTVPSGSPVDTSTPGRFTFTVTTADALGNVRSVANTYDVTAGDLTTTVPANSTATLTTDPGGVGPSTDVPIQTTIQFTAPGGADTPVSIDLHPADVDAPSGYEILGNAVDIDLGGLVRPADDPIVITFVIDSSTGADPATITVSRTNADSSVDIAVPCDAVGIADPDPCLVADWVAGPGSDVRVTIYTTHASQWLALGSTDPTPPVITPNVTGSMGSGGWYRSDVGVGWSVADPESAILTAIGCGRNGHCRHSGNHDHVRCEERRGAGDVIADGQARRDAADGLLPAGGLPPRCRWGAGDGDGHRRDVRAGERRGLDERGYFDRRPALGQPDGPGPGRPRHDRELCLRRRLPAGQPQAGPRSRRQARRHDQRPVQAPDGRRQHDLRRCRQGHRLGLRRADPVQRRQRLAGLRAVRRQGRHVPVRPEDLEDARPGHVRGHRPGLRRPGCRDDRVDDGRRPEVGSAAG